ncbi:MAG: hypothetical protein P4M14_11710 [Gammaproteobacteria bacterium]|nr:hypothetical protein [Gammaproteobacteria bacterium]
MKVLVSATPVALWREIIHEAESLCGTQLQEEIEAYLVFMLVRYMDKPEMVKQIMATSFLEGLKLSANQREVVLKGVGDTCLLFAGLFPGATEKRLVKIGYFINLGRSAYSNISKSHNDVYGRLTRHFVTIMDVLQSTRCYTKECPDLLPLQAYDLWNESGSQRALGVLKQYTKATPISINLNDEDDSLIRFK